MSFLKYITIFLNVEQLVECRLEVIIKCLSFIFFYLLMPTKDDHYSNANIFFVSRLPFSRHHINSSIGTDDKFSIHHVSINSIPVEEKFLFYFFFGLLFSNNFLLRSFFDPSSPSTEFFSGDDGGWHDSTFTNC